MSRESAAKITESDFAVVAVNFFKVCTFRLQNKEWCIII